MKSSPLPPPSSLILTLVLSSSDPLTHSFSLSSSPSSSVPLCYSLLSFSLFLPVLSYSLPFLSLSFSYFSLQKMEGQQKPLMLATPIILGAKSASKPTTSTSDSLKGIFYISSYHSFALPLSLYFPLSPFPLPSLFSPLPSPFPLLPSPLSSPLSPLPISPLPLSLSPFTLFLVTIYFRTWRRRGRRRRRRRRRRYKEWRSHQNDIWKFGFSNRFYHQGSPLPSLSSLSSCPFLSLPVSSCLFLSLLVSSCLFSC